MHPNTFPSWGGISSEVQETKWKWCPQSCPTLCDPMDYTVCGILQARILEWVTFPFSRGSSQPRDRPRVSCIADGFFTNWAVREALRGQNKVPNHDNRDQGEGVENSPVWCWLRTNQIKSVKNQDQMSDQKLKLIRKLSLEQIDSRKGGSGKQKWGFSDSISALTCG